MAAAESSRRSWVRLGGEMPASRMIVRMGWKPSSGFLGASIFLLLGNRGPSHGGGPPLVIVYHDCHCSMRSSFSAALSTINAERLMPSLFAPWSMRLKMSGGILIIVGFRLCLLVGSVPEIKASALRFAASVVFRLGFLAIAIWFHSNSVCMYRLKG